MKHDKYPERQPGALNAEIGFIPKAEAWHPFAGHYYVKTGWHGYVTKTGTIEGETTNGWFKAKPVAKRALAKAEAAAAKLVRRGGRNMRKNDALLRYVMGMKPEAA